MRVPEQLMRAMAAEAEAAREARAKIIAAEGEEKASSSLRNAANIISENKGALQVHLIKIGEDKLFSIFLISASIFANSEQHIGGKQQHNYFSCSS